MTAETTKALLRGAVFSLIISVVPIFFMVGMPLFSGQRVDPASLPVYIGAALLFGVTAYLAIIFTRRVQDKVGRLTGYAALAGVMALAGTALALVLPNCPGSLDGAACTVSEGASWGLSGALLVILLTSLWVIGTSLVSIVRKGGAWGLRKRRERLEERRAEREQEELQDSRAAAKHRDPQAPKGYATPKSPQNRKNKPSKRKRP